MSFSKTYSKEITIPIITMNDIAIAVPEISSAIPKIFIIFIDQRFFTIKCNLTHPERCTTHLIFAPPFVSVIGTTLLAYTVHSLQYVYCRYDFDILKNLRVYISFSHRESLVFTIYYYFTLSLLCTILLLATRTI